MSIAEQSGSARQESGRTGPGEQRSCINQFVEISSELLKRTEAALPRDPLARWAAVFYSGFVLTLVFSIAATQAFLAVAAVLYFAYLLRAKPRIGFPPVKIPLALFCIFTVISVFFAENPAAGGFEIRKLALFLILLLTVNLIISADHLIFLIKAILVESAVAGLAGIYEFVQQYRRVRIVHPHRVYTFMTVTRIDGFMGHWMNFGGQQMLIFLMAAGLLLLVSGRESLSISPAKRDRFMRSHAILWLAEAIVAISILLNLTRGVWLGCFIGLIYLVARWRTRWLWVVPVIVAILLIAGPRLVKKREESVLHPSRDPSIAIRLQMWQVGLRMMERHPWVGVGPNNIKEVYPLYLPPGEKPIVGYHEHLHNDFVQFAAERGLPCLAAWLWFMIALLVGAVRISRKLKHLPWVAYGAIALWLAFIAEGIFEFNFGTSPVLMVFLFLAATPFAAEKIEQREKMPAPLAPQ